MTKSTYDQSIELEGAIHVKAIVSAKIWTVSNFGLRGPIWMLDPILETSDPIIGCPTLS